MKCHDFDEHHTFFFYFEAISGRDDHFIFWSLIHRLEFSLSALFSSFLPYVCDIDCFSDLTTLWCYSERFYGLYSQEAYVYLIVHFYCLLPFWPLRTFFHAHQLVAYLIRTLQKKGWAQSRSEITTFFQLNKKSRKPDEVRAGLKINTLTRFAFSVGAFSCMVELLLRCVWTVRQKEITWEKML